MTTSTAIQMESPPAGLPARHAITVDEYLRMGEAGILAPDACCELIEGEIIDMPPIGPSHASKTNRLVEILSLAVPGKAIVSTQNPIILGDLSAPQPDIALLRYRDDYYALAHPTAADSLLLIEVADTSLTHDRNTKLPLYARFQVPEVWIIDSRGGHLDVHRTPDAERYTWQFRVTDLSEVEVMALPELSLNLSSIF